MPLLSSHTNTLRTAAHTYCFRALPRSAAPRLARSHTRTMATAHSPAQVLGAGSPEPAVGPDAKHPTFITTWSCPYAQRTWILLNEKGIKYTPVFVDLKNKPEWFFKWNPYGRVPTLVWREEGKETSLYESLICNEYLEDLAPGALPKGPAAAAQVRLLIDQFGVKVASANMKVMFAGQPGEGAQELDEALRWLDGQLSAEGPFAVGPTFTLADAAMAPFLLRLEVLGPLNGYEVPADLPRLSAYIQALKAHPAVASSCTTPEGTAGSYAQELVEVYKEYVAARKAAAAK